MRHANKTHKIGRTASHRKATLQSMSAALIEHKRIKTTLGKARALRVFVEPILHRAKDDSTAGRRQAFRHLQNKEAVKELYGSVAEAIGTRPGGYTRIVKLGQRGGDAAEMAIVEIVDFFDAGTGGSGGAKRKTRRSRARGTSAAPAAEKATTPAEAPAAEAPAEDAPAEETPADETDTAEETTETTDEAAAETAPEHDAVPPVDPAAEAAHSTNPNPDTTGNPQIPTGPSGGSNPDSARGDAEQGAPPRTGDPNPESHATNLGRSGHRG